MSDITTRLSTALDSRYRIERELGAGGMATVHLAHDLKHDRDVAIKVLHPDLGAALGSERFLAEIKTTAKLQHPHILPLLDSGDADGLLYYVMPVVTGETLRARLERDRQLPIPEAVRIAREVASALDYAHRQGVIHRDIKPENILLHEGQALVADFGIALAVQTAGGSRMTQTGLSLGTPQYMSPEQAMGERTIDARSDIYALGAVAYEMLAGDAPFTGSSVQAIVAKVLSERPTPLHTLRDTVPAGVEHAVLTALAKLPADRQATAAEFATALGAEGTTHTELRAAPTAISNTWRSRALIFAAVAVVATVAAIIAWMRPAPTSATSRQQVVLWQRPFDQILTPGAAFVASQAAIAPDGSSIVFSDSTADGYMLRRKRRDAVEPETMAGTQGAISPFFSPDGKWVGYVTLDGKLKKVPATGGGPVTLVTDLSSQAGGTAAWLDDGTVLYQDQRGDVVRKSAEGGAPTAVISKADAWVTVWPLPGSKGVLFTKCNGNCAVGSDVYVFDFATDSMRLLVPNAAGVWYAPTGHLLYTSRDGGLYAAGFDVKRLAMTSGAVPVLADVEPGAFSISASGSALYSVDASVRNPFTLQWVARDGKETPYDSTWRARFEYPEFSHDGSQLAVSVRDKSTDLWIRRADGTRLKVLARDGVSWRASWAPDDQSLAFISVPAGQDGENGAQVYRVRADGRAPAEQVFKHRFGVWEVELSRDGQWLVYRTDEEGSNSNVRARRLTGDTATLPLLTGPAFETQVALSPDGKWLAYRSNQNGANEVYVASFPSMAPKYVVSRGSGSEPRWAHNGHELFFKAANDMMVVELRSGPPMTTGEPHALFSTSGYRSARNRQQYDVSLDDNRFLMIREGERRREAVYVEGWFTELKAKFKQ